MATLKHINSKNADYGAAEQYLLFEHDEFTMKPVLDETGRLIPREDYRLSTLNCDGEDFAVACMRANLRYQKNQRREDVKSHHYIISFDPRDGPDNGLTVDRAQALGEQFCKEHFPGHQALVCTHPDGHNHSGNISGKPVTSKPVYGYVMDEDENFIIDEEAAPVVQQIYQLCLAGNGPTKIARMLTEQQIPTPGTLEYQRTGSTRRYHPGYECKWATNTVVHILENREYTGCLVNFKTEKPSYKVKHSIENPVEKQAIFENHHEPIIDKETWERVQELRKQRKRPNRYDEVGLFSGILFCADCGHVLYQQRYQNKDRKQDCYICGSYKKRTRNCTAHFIRTDLLTAGVLANLRQVTEYAAKHESRFVKLLVQQNEIGGKRKTAAAIKQLEQAQERISEISRIIKRLYEDNVNGKISDERFMELSADYEAEQAELKKRAAALQAELDKSQAATVNAEKFMGIVRKHLAFEELTPTLLREMIEKIVVHECSYDENGTRRQDIEIYYSFVGKIDLPE